MNEKKTYRILFLHHSTGEIIFNAGEKPSLIERKLFKSKAYVKRWFKNYNKNNGSNYSIESRYFPMQQPYGWQNYPYDYYNIWVKHSGNNFYLNEPTLEFLTKKYDLIIFKHCYPVGDIVEDSNQPDVDSPIRSIENYKLQYEALKQKIHQFPETKFMIWTGAAKVRSATSKDQSERARVFFDWVKNEWNRPNDNIYIFDFYNLETEGSLYFKEEYAINTNDSHPGKSFAKRVAPLFCQRIVEVIEMNK